MSQASHAAGRALSRQGRGAGRGVPIAALPALATAERGSGEAYRAWPRLGAPRYLIPDTAANAPFALAAPQTLAGRALTWLIRHRRLGRRLWLDGAAVAELEAAIARTLGVPSVKLAFSAGTPGAYRKATIQVVSPSGAVLAFAKAAAQGRAADRIAAEERVLGRLAGYGALAGHIPQLLGSFAWRGASVLLLSPGPGAAGPQTADARHVELLAALHRATASMAPFRTSPFRGRLALGVMELLPELQRPWRLRLLAVCERLDRRLGAQPTPCVLAHRDFTPWNTQSGPGGLFVLDWEMAEAGALPLGDALCFSARQAMVGLASGWTDDLARRLAGACWPEGEAMLPELRLGFLVEEAIFYARARIEAPAAGEAGELAWLGREIDRELEGGR